MKKIMFDSNTFSYLINECSNLKTFFIRCAEKYHFYITAIQVEELANIGDEKRNIRIAHLLCLYRMRATLVNTRGIYGRTRYGYCNYADKTDNTYKNLLNENKSNINDALIGETAKRENCTLVTDDTRFIAKLNTNGISTMTFKEFYDSVEQECE